jgi:uncharacterized cupredoxin-like copper-binding protein
MSSVRHLAVCSALAALAIAPSAALGGAPTIELVKVRMSDYRIRLDHAHNRGYFAFDVRNTGKVQHEFVIVKTARTAKKLPVANGEVSHHGWKGAAPLQPGEHKRIIVAPNLRPGHYVLICGIPGHYQKGMRRDFTLH